MPRTRTQDASKPTAVTYLQTWNNRGPDAGSVPSQSWEGSRKQMTDTVTPNFLTKKRRGELILSDCDVWTWDRSYSPMSLVNVSQQADGYQCVWSGDGSGLIESLIARDSSLESSIPAMRSEALVKAYAKIRGETIMSGEVLADLGTSLEMLRRPLSGARKHLGNYLKEAGKHAKKTSTSISRAHADAWLEYRYGMTPLVMDANTSLQLAAENELRLRGERRVVRSTVKAHRNTVTPYTDISLPHWGWTATGTMMTDESISCHAGVIYDIQLRSRSQQLSEDLKLGVDSLASTAYNLLTLSFVADWFSNVGDWIEAMNLPPSVTIRGNWVSTRISISWGNTTTQLKMPVGSPVTYKYGTLGSSVNQFEQLVRLCNQSLPTMPQVTVNYDGKQGLVVKRSLDGLSLVSGGILDLIDKALRGIAGKR